MSCLAPNPQPQHSQGPKHVSCNLLPPEALPVCPLPCLSVGKDSQKATESSPNPGNWTLSPNSRLPLRARRGLPNVPQVEEVVRLGGCGQQVVQRLHIPSGKKCRDVPVFYLKLDNLVVNTFYIVLLA